MPRNPFLMVALGIGLLAALVLFLNWLFPGALAQNDAAPSLVHQVLLLTFLISSVALSGRTNLKEGIRYALVWAAIGFALVLGYSMRHEFQGLGTRMMSALIPSLAVQMEPGMVAVAKSRNGHFMARAQVTGPELDSATVVFLVDTGATNVALTPGDARRIGVDPQLLRFDQIINTANGTNKAASVRLPRITIGDVEVRNIRASVVAGGLDVSLLGHSFLDGLSGYEVKDDHLILRQ